MHRADNSLEQLERRALLSAGNIDASFGTKGIVTMRLGGAIDSVSAAMEPDGRTVVVAAVEATNSSPESFAVIRFHSDGTLDKTFGQSGSVRFTEQDYFYHLVPPQFDDAGRIVVEDQGRLIRLTAHGKRDTSFASGGFLDESNLGAFHVRPDGKVIAVIGDGVDRFLNTGQLDTAFGKNGRTMISMSVPNDEPPATPNSDSLAVAADGSIFVPVVDTEQDDPGYAGIVHLGASGRIDSTFGTQGLSALTHGSGPVDVVATADGGAVLQLVGTDGGVEFLKVQSDGKIDPTFGDFNLLGFQQGDPVQLASAGDGKFIGLMPEDWQGDLPPDHDFPLARLNANGTLDPTFGGNGWTALPQQIEQTEGSPMAIAVAPDGSIIAAGEGNPDDYSDYAPLILTSIQTSPAHAPLSGTSLGSDGTLTINGTTAADTITVDDGTNALQTGDYYSAPGAPQITVDVNGVVGLFDPKKVQSIHIEGAAGDDQINLSYSENLPATVNGGKGNDSISSSISAPSALSGGDGSDTISSGSGIDAVFGNDGNDYLDAGAGDDCLDGGAGNDRLAGEAGNDTLWGDEGNDTLLGGSGNDEFHAKDGQVDSLNGGPGTDKASADQTASVKDILQSIETVV
jgi:uncharacterized delta-60 repeat protein